MVRAPLWLIGVLLVVAIGVGMYAYFTEPLPLGLSSFVRTPGGALVAATPVASGTPASVSGQPLVLGAVSVTLVSVARPQEVANGPPGTFTLVTLRLANAGSDPVAPAMGDFRLVDDRGRTYAVDMEATRAAAAAARQRDVFDASVPPDGQVDTVVAFETPTGANPVTLRVTLGYGELTLPR